MSYFRRFIPKTWGRMHRNVQTHSGKCNMCRESFPCICQHAFETSPKFNWFFNTLTHDLKNRFVLSSLYELASGLKFSSANWPPKPSMVFGISTKVQTFNVLSFCLDTCAQTNTCPYSHYDSLTRKRVRRVQNKERPHSLTQPGKK